MNYPAAETAGYQKVESMLSVVIPTCSESFFKKDSGHSSFAELRRTGARMTENKVTL